jgi:hypothetical protein
MQKKWLMWLNAALSVLIGLFCVGTAALALSRPSDISLPDVVETKGALPKNSFLLSKMAYDAISQTAFSLKFSPPTMLLPDLRSHLTYYGTNGRPDAIIEGTRLHFALAHNKSPGSTSPGERLYLMYDKKQSPPRYVFSPGNAETSLWIEALQDKSEALVKVGMMNELGEQISEPATYAEFTLPEKELARFATGGNWEIGIWRVDGSLLARQRAHWYGPDLFLENHGGEEFSNVKGKQRIDFGEDEDTYSCYVTVGDNLVWENDRWNEVAPGMDSRGKPLMHLRKIDDRLINFELWDEEGKSRIVLNLIKSNDSWAPQQVLNDFKFIGARTRTQCAFEIDEERMLLKPQDWLLQTDDDGWVKLETPEEIDDYVNRKLTGTLFIFDGLVKKEDKQLLTGLIYNSARTEVHTMEMAVQQSNVSVVPNVPESLNSKKIEQQAKVILPHLSPAHRRS